MLRQFWNYGNHGAKQLIKIASGHVAHMGNAEGLPFDLSVTVIKGKSNLTQTLLQQGQINASRVTGACQGQRTVTRLGKQLEPARRQPVTHMSGQIAMPFPTGFQSLGKHPFQLAIHGKYL